MRCAEPIHFGAGRLPSLPYIHIPPSTCSVAKTNATVVNHALRWRVEVKNHLTVVSDAGSCALP